jgi:2-oxoglutarate ferredoxin oxidoreductase subunit beta
VVHEVEDINNKMAQVIEKSNEWGNKIPIGIFYQNEHIPTYQERILARVSDYIENPPYKQAISDENNKSISNIDKLLAELRVDN